MTDATDLAPWKHPNAERWFTNLIEDNSIALALDAELVRAEGQHDAEKIRMIHALALLLGRDGIWPKHRDEVLKSAVRAANGVSKDSDAGTVGKPLTVAEHQGRSATDQSLQHEVELMRRRLKMSNRKTKLGPPKTWGNLWE